MKIIVCGPPHSGKSVFIANLEKYLPSDSFITIRVNRDGEGIWSNNKNQKVTKIVREKHDYGDDFIRDICNVIDKSTLSIVLVDIGGRLSKDKLPIFKSCDSFIVLSNNETDKEKWEVFGNSLGLECLATLDSVLNSKEQIYNQQPYLQGKISSLERGVFLEQSLILEELSKEIIEKSNYKNNSQNIDDIIDFNAIASEIGCVTLRELPDGTKIENAFFNPKDSSKIFDLMKEKFTENKDFKINGARANWVSAIAISSLKKSGAKNISIFDAGYSKYIPVKKFSQKKNANADGLKYHIVESQDSVFIDIDITKPRYSIEDYEKCEVPKINTKKTLYISGKLPLWLFNSISLSYSSKEKFVFQPGNGFICYESENEKNLGTLVESPKGINIIEYFENKKNETTKQKENNFKKSLAFSSSPVGINPPITSNEDMVINTSKGQELQS